MTLATSFVARAQEVVARYPPQVEREASALFRDVMSPYCPGMTLATCPSAGAGVMRDSLRMLLAAGESRRAVLRGLRARYGPGILARPEPTGLGLLAWIAPFALLLGGGFGITRWVRRSARRPATIPSAAPHPLEPDDVARLDAAIRLDE